MSGYPPKRQERGIDMAKSEGIKLIANNKKAYHDYFIDENGMIGAEKNNYFIPNLSTLINGYANKNYS